MAEWRLAAHRHEALSAARAQMDADRAELRRLLAMDDREREAYFLASKRNMLRMFAGAAPTG